MKKYSIWLIIAVLVFVSLINPVSAVDSTAEAAAGQVSVTSVTLDPAVFIEGDTGTITVEVTNNGVQSVPLRRASMYDPDIRVVSNSYDTATSIGAGNKMTFVFTVEADVPEGIYYPVFSLDFRDAGYLRYPVKLQVQNDKLEISVVEKPDTFSEGKKDTVRIIVGNPRDNQVNGVIVYPTGQGLDIIPTSYFIGNIDPDSSTGLSLSVTPDKTTTLNIKVEYKNGVNTHTSQITVPVVLGESKKQANPILSNIVVNLEGETYSVTGDVTNAGLEVANSVVVMGGEGVSPVDPYRKYVVGSLQPDDFSSFEITFQAENLASVPIVVTYKDVDGNTFEKTTSIDIPELTPGAGKEGGIPLPVIGLVIVLAVIIGGVIWYSWRKRDGKSV
jgi:hypothetical protein